MFSPSSSQHEIQHAVRAGVLRPHVHGHRLGADAQACDSASARLVAVRLSSALRLRRAPRADVRRELLGRQLHRLTTTPCPCESAPGSPCAADGRPSRPAIRMRRRSGWPSNDDAEQVVHLALEPAGGRIDRRSRVGTRGVGARHAHLQAQPPRGRGARPALRVGRPRHARWYTTSNRGSAGQIVGGRHLDEQRELQRRIVAQRAADLDQVLAIDVRPSACRPRAPARSRRPGTARRSVSATTGASGIRHQARAALTRSSAAGRSCAAAARCRR